MMSYTEMELIYSKMERNTKDSLSKEIETALVNISILMEIYMKDSGSITKKRVREFSTNSLYRENLKANLKKTKNKVWGHMSIQMVRNLQVISLIIIYKERERCSLEKMSLSKVDLSMDR